MATEVRAQLAERSLPSPKGELKLEKKSGCQPRSHGDSGPQKELMIPGIVDFKLIREAVRTSKPQTPSAYRFGRLSHHSFFSRHHPQPQHVTHIQDLTGKPVCVVRDELSLPTISVPVGDPQSNRDPRLYSEAWKKELKDLASRVAIFTKESELKSKEKEEPQREQGAKYSAETGRLIPASTWAMARRHSHQGRNQPASRDEGDQTFVLQDQELLILELLSQILQTDSLNAIQFWLLYAPAKEKDMALGLLQTAVAQLLPQPLVPIPAEKLLNQLLEVQDSLQERHQLPYSQSPKKMKTPPLSKSEKPENIGKAQVLRVHSSQNPEEKAAKAEG
uniref:Protein TBATA n=1 Tax=Bos taurus TaxID=9913 RepID=TBATA_BOVIN|nr:RecName: Full=Protein TBATA; AltName: Full=Protein SPATIAL; AltName: Full=Stromal protein associated with thymii and lymph node homolog; AltName: Full=Thymus, brain and testes-associated protein [Bos taurus]AAI10032.1 Chromosome 10 open reading frame 27 ortholog [Bos taurus]